MIPTKTFALAGNATFTARSKKTGAHLTFKIQKGKKEGAPHFVNVMTGTCNENDFETLGTIFDGRTYVHNRNRSRISPDAPSAKAFAYVWAHIERESVPGVEIMHAGACCRCGRKLTNPESIESGIGPECAGKL